MYMGIFDYQSGNSQGILIWVLGMNPDRDGAIRGAVVVVAPHDSIELPSAPTLLCTVSTYNLYDLLFSFLSQYDRSCSLKFFGFAH